VKVNKNYGSFEGLIRGNVKGSLEEMNVRCGLNVQKVCESGVMLSRKYQTFGAKAWKG